jgi:hypothetical protein
MLRVANKPFMPSVVRLNVIMLGVVAPLAVTTIKKAHAELEL